MKGYFNPRAPYGTRLIGAAIVNAEDEFQSTRPVRDATASAREADTASGISIHAPRTGRD